MKNINSYLAILMAFVAGVVSMPSQAQGQILTGDTRYACEAIMCLAAGQRPNECDPSIRRYFSISHSKPHKTLEARRDFLKLCPASNQNSEMQSFVDALSRGAGRCDAIFLNSMGNTNNMLNSTPGISNVMPDYCQVMGAHQYSVAMILPRYVGLPQRGGMWVEPADYERALSEYNVRIQREDNERLMQTADRF